MTEFQPFEFFYTIGNLWYLNGDCLAQANNGQSYLAHTSEPSQICQRTYVKSFIHLAESAHMFKILTQSQPAITCSKVTIETLEQGVKYNQS